jgi:hypothetical protein
MEVDSEPPNPSMAPPQQLQLQGEVGPPNSPEFSCTMVFMGTPISPAPHGSGFGQMVKNLDGTTSYITVASSDRVGRDPSSPPPVGKPVKKKAISGDSDLSVFDILNTFCH